MMFLIGFTLPGLTGRFSPIYWPVLPHQLMFEQTRHRPVKSTLPDKNGEIIYFLYLVLNDVTSMPDARGPRYGSANRSSCCAPGTQK